MNKQQALAFIRRHGVVLMSARGPVPNLAEAIAGERIRGSWWGHPRAQDIFTVSEAVCASPDIVRCRLVGGKVTFVHRRLWPALVRLAGQIPTRSLAALREEHTERGFHRAVLIPFPAWVPQRELDRGARVREDRAIAELGPGLFELLSSAKRTKVRGAHGN